jgi:choline kinase
MTSALILAAGMGTRLMPLTKDRPKALVEVGERTLLGGLIAACAAADLDDVVVVTGCMHERIDHWLAEARPQLPVTTVFNAKYAELGNAWSVAVAAEALAGRDFIKLDGDLVLDSQILRGLCALSGSAAALDTRADLDDEAMKATATAGRITAFGKWLDVASSTDDVVGESIGVERIAAADAPVVFEALRRIVEDQPHAYYEDAYHQLVVKGALQMAAYDIADAKWAEIDSAEDLERARRLFGRA